MKGNYKYSILEKYMIIIQFYQYDITFKGAKKLKHDVLQDKRYNSNYRILVDTRLANICMTTDEVKDYKKWVEEKSLRFGSDAILTSTPKQVAMSMTLKSVKNLEMLNYKIFSTLESSLEHLNIDISNIEIIENEIEGMIEK